MNYEDLLGIPFENGGDGTLGFDCYTLSKEVCKRKGILLPDKQTDILSTAKFIADRSKAISSGAEEDYIRLNKPEDGCIVTFNLRGNFVNHMGVMLDEFHFIHIMRKRSVAVEKIDHKYWAKKVEGFYRYVDKSNNSS